MKNIHVLSTDKPSRLYYNGTSYKDPNSTMAMDWFISSAGYKPQNIYITSDEEIEDGNWYLYLKDNKAYRFIKRDHTRLIALHIQKKIILTTDQDLIKDRVQAIPDEFLEWFVKNPSCEKVEVERMFNVIQFTPREYIYKIIIPKEEPKQETLEEDAKRMCKELLLTPFEKPIFINGIKEGIKWQAERMYSEEEIEKIISKLMDEVHRGDICFGDNIIDFKVSPRQWLEQFKKK